MSKAENSKITTMKLGKETKDRIDKLRVHKRESYDEILQRLLGILNLCVVNPERAQGKLKGLEQLKRRGKAI